MSLPPRRIVTGHDADGSSVVAIDEPATNATVRRAGHRSFVIWTTPAVPADNRAEAHAHERLADRSIGEGTVFRLVEYAPGVASAPHRTDSVDYAVVVSGEIDLVLDTETVQLSAGDVLVQRGTRHDWINRGPEPCVIAFCLIGALPLPPPGGLGAA